MSDLYTHVRAAVVDAAGISINARLTPIAGSQHVLPPTYFEAPYRHNMTTPNAQGVAAWVSIDSAASFANRIEEQLKRANLGLDPLRVQVAGQTLSTLQLPHRAYDAILRDSCMDGQPFRQSDIGRAVIAASPDNAAAVLRYDPALLLLGGWDSTGLHGNYGQKRKWPAAVSVEIYGSNATPLCRAKGRIDPLALTSNAGRAILAGDSYRLLAEGEEAPKGAVKRLSEINHGNSTPSLEAKGVLVEEIKLAGALSLTRLRRYHFGSDADSDIAARLVLALMAIYGVAAVLEDGLDLRRSCELVVDSCDWSIRRTAGREPLAVNVAEARQALQRALADIELATPVLFTADANLEQLVAQSR